MTKDKWLTIEDVLNRLPSGAVGTDARALVRRAYEVAQQAHAGQQRDSGEPYIQHPLHVADLLAEINFESEVVAAGMLHDVLEETKVTPMQLEEQFGKEIRILVEGVTKIEDVEELTTQDDIRDLDLQELESLRKMFLAMAEDDIRIIFIKLADRLHNMRTLGFLSKERQKRIAHETLEIFAPLANRLGIWAWKAELQDLAFRYLNPAMYEELAGLLDARKTERAARVEKHIEMLRQALAKENIAASIKGRPKHLYSIYRKMQRKQIPFARVYDTEGLRVIVASAHECYQVLGVLHRLWTPVHGEFDDYIANPKLNGYQSLHTAVISEDGLTTFEVQIRTREMDKVAELGVAAHWLYKEQNAVVTDQMRDYIARMRQSVRDLTQDAQDTRALIEGIRSDVFEERVYVFTPRGKIVDLPEGATPLDFAYHVHTEIGHRCRGARVNGKWTPMDYALKTGDQVEIISGRKGGPSRDWLNAELGFTKTNRARQKIRQWFRHQSRDENIARGRGLVEQELKRLDLRMTLDDVAELFTKHYQRADDFFAAVGTGDVTSDRIVNRIEDLIQKRSEQALTIADLEEESEDEADAIESPLPEAVGRVDVQGAGALLTRMAKCCSPLPGEEVIGYVTRGHGVTIHRRDCANILRLEREERERLIELDWGVQQDTFPVRVRVTAYDRAKLLHDLSTVIANENVNLAKVSMGKRDRYNIITIHMTLDVPNLSKLNRVLGKMEQIRNVIEARRFVKP
ncbi:MAG: bifunctional (p)ppGpp synthetase/guanosine-3',5'-bis(diphosphate) 3'-pyrophosphohydrolase [Anaerolineae bacterium]|nr:bifunctional (p)ppGpp synthetase/guanosine-3',5'-bis(diphosphate) 3'-pyrophosphohydrolase [Anaerolineae bacterium]